MKPLLRGAGMALIALLFGSGLSATTALRASAIEVSPVAERAFEDVTTCLTSGREKALDVFYLIDQSGSLSRTDPEQVRVEIIQNSVAELGSFVEQGIKVRVAAAGFADGVRSLNDWEPISSAADAQALGTSLSRQMLEVTGNYQNWTDWEAGLRFAKEAFRDNPESCAMLIWFTDGAINPSASNVLDSLAALCRPELADGQIASGAGQFGLMQEFRTAGIPIFGVYLSDEVENSLMGYQSTWLTGFMKPLVEGQASLPAVEDLPGGELTCGQVDNNGFAPPGQANGAFIDAADPVLLAFQFLRIGGQISGGKGISITDGRFAIPLGTAGFEIIVSSSDWALTGPPGSEVAASSASPGISAVSQSGGATKISVGVGNDERLYGEWQLATTAQYSELFLYTGLTIELDRDKTSTILSDFDNTLTGRVVRTQEFRALQVDLDLYPGSNFNMSLLENGVLARQDIDLVYTADGQFKIERFNPGTESGSLELWLTLDLGVAFQPITSRFNLSIVDKTALATPANDFIQLTALEGPAGVASGTLTIVGPNVSDTSTFCLSVDPTRLDDSLLRGEQPINRSSEFGWSFSGLTPTAAGNCVEVAQGENKSITIEARNPTQANSAVTSSWQVTSTTPGTAAAFDAPLTIQFDSVTQSNRAVEIAAIIALLISGLFLPLALMWVINWLGTRLLPIENLVRASFPVHVDQSGPFAKLVAGGNQSEQSPVTVSPEDFKNLLDRKAVRDFDAGAGTVQSRVPLFPLAATWYQWNAPEGHRVVGFFDGGSKNSKAFAAGASLEVSPNMGENWALVIPDSELRKNDTENISGELVVFSRLANLAEYQKRVAEISMKPGLGDKIAALKTAVESDGAATKDGETPISTSPFGLQEPPEGFTPSAAPMTRPDSPLQPPRPPQSGPLAPPPPPPPQ